MTTGDKLCCNIFSIIGVLIVLFTLSNNSSHFIGDPNISDDTDDNDEINDTRWSQHEVSVLFRELK